MKKGDKVIVDDPGIMDLYRIMVQSDPKVKPQNRGWIEKIYEDGNILVKFPIGDDDPNEHSQVAPYPAHAVILKDW